MQRLPVNSILYKRANRKHEPHIVLIMEIHSIIVPPVPVTDKGDLDRRPPLLFRLIRPRTPCSNAGLTADQQLESIFLENYRPTAMRYRHQEHSLARQL